MGKQGTGEDTDPEARGETCNHPRRGVAAATTGGVAAGVFSEARLFNLKFSFLFGGVDATTVSSDRKIVAKS